jgi:hypothetical protein
MALFFIIAGLNQCYLTLVFNALPQKIASMKKLYLLSFVFLLALMPAARAQNVFFGMGYAGALLSTPHEVRFNVFYPAATALGAGYSFGFDAPIVPINDDMSVGLHLSPTIGGFITPGQEFIDGFGYFGHAPLMAQFNWGNFSTSNATKEYGVGFGLGMNTTYTFKSSSFLDSPAERGKSLLLQPAARLSFRWWSQSSSLNTINLVYSIGSDQSPNSGPQNRNTLLLSLIRYSNY